MRVPRTLALAAVAAVTVIAALAPASVLAASSGTECGVVNAYTAPDPVGPTNGSIQFGLSGPVETIVAAATMDPNVTADLPGQTGNGSITCLDVTADGSGHITALAYAPGGQVSGPVVYDAGQDAYIVADRIFVPAAQLVSQPDLVPIIKVPAEAGQTLTVTITVDTANGNPSTFHTASSVSGTVAFNGTGDALIGGATLPAGVVTGHARSALRFAHAAGSSADVDLAGAIDTTSGTFTLGIGVDTIACATVQSRTESSITIDGVTFALGGGATASASLKTGVEAGVRLRVTTGGTLTISKVGVGGCGSVAPITPPATDTDTTGPMEAITDFSSVALVLAMLGGWYGAAVAIRRRSARPTRDR